MRATPFRIGLGVIAAAGLTAILFLHDPTPVRVAHQHAEDAGPTGYRAAWAYLDSLGIPTVDVPPDRFLPGYRMVVLLEPRVELPGDAETLTARLDRILWSDGSVDALVVLPKWERHPDDAPGIAKLPPELPEATLDATLPALADSLTVHRPGAGEGGTRWGELGRSARLSRPQLVSGAPEGIRILVGDADGWVLAEHGLTLVLADPDLITNAGIGRGANAELFTEYLATYVTAIVIDDGRSEVGLALAVRELLRPPLGLFTASLLLLSAIAMWAAFRRMGEARPAPPRMARGKAAFLDRASEMLTEAGHRGDTLTRYLEQCERAVARHHALPADLSPPVRRDRLATIESRRPVPDRLSELVTAVTELRFTTAHPAQAAVLRLALRIHAWRRSLTVDPLTREP